jgi:tellurite resistance-related uncharacterized protein
MSAASATTNPPAPDRTVAEPYGRTPEFDNATLPDALKNAHSTKAGTWGLLVVSEGEVRLVFEEDHDRTCTVRPGHPAPIPPQAPHHVELTGPMRMYVEFHHENPLG